MRLCSWDWYRSWGRAFTRHKVFSYGTPRLCDIHHWVSYPKSFTVSLNKLSKLHFCHWHVLSSTNRIHFLVNRQIPVTLSSSQKCTNKEFPLSRRRHTFWSWSSKSWKRKLTRVARRLAGSPQASLGCAVLTLWQYLTSELAQVLVTSTEYGCRKE